MKISQLILLTIISLAIFFTLVGNPMITSEIYLSVITLSLLFGAFKKDVNIVHISCLLLAFNLLEYIVFGYGLIDLSTFNKNPVIHGSIVFGTSLLLSIIAVLTFIFRVQISRVISKSDNIELTYFDGLFHWVFIYTSLIQLLALVEHLVRHVLGLRNITFVYHSYEALIYIAWALICGLILTMIIISIKSTPPREPEVS
jgi:hypothetical protein